MAGTTTVRGAAQHTQAFSLSVHMFPHSTPAVKPSARGSSDSSGIDFSRNGQAGRWSKVWWMHRVMSVWSHFDVYNKRLCLKILITVGIYR